MLNQITMMGRLVRDPELRRTPTGVAVATFTIACESDYADGQGNRKTIFVDCVAWRATAEFVSKHFTKGRLAVVQGVLDIREWEKDGTKRRNAEIVCDNIYFADAKQRDASAPAN